MNSYDGYDVLDDKEWEAFLDESEIVKPSVTAEQQRVIDADDADILVSAAAGSGKTWVLVKRIINRIIKERVDIDRFLIVTFTNAAAAEMRIRIADAIAEEIEKAYEADDKPLVEFLNRQATLVNMAEISTIDSFCGRIVKDNFMTIGIDPSYRIGDKSELSAMADEVVGEVLEDCFAKEDEVFNELVSSYLNGMSDEKIADIIKGIYDFQTSMPDPKSWIIKSKDLLRNDDVWFEEILKHTRNLLESALLNASELYSYVETLDNSEKNCAAVRNDMDIIEEIVAYANKDGLNNAERYEKLYNLLRSIPNAKRFCNDGFDKADKDRLKKWRGNYRDKILKNQIRDMLFITDGESLIKDKAECIPVIDKLLDTAEEFRVRFDAKKKEKLIFSFADIEHMALNILKNVDDEGAFTNTPIADKLKSQYVEIMIDEYQDSNFLQEEILSSVASGNMFMVGDRKQSIYRFRMARPELFNGKYSCFGTKEHTELIELDKNFRSSSNVLQSINYIFDRIMHADIGGVEYDDAASLKCGASYPKGKFNLKYHTWLNGKEDGYYYDNDLEIAIYESGRDVEEVGTDDDNSGDGGNEDYSTAELDAKTIALKIHNMMFDKHHYLVKDNSVSKYSETAYRPLEYRDIVILLRSPGSVVNSYVRVLNDSGIPTATASSKGYFDTHEIRTVLSLLEVIDNPAQDVAVTATMRHYFGGFSMEDLAFVTVIFNEAIDKQMLEDDLDVGNYRMYDKLLFIRDSEVDDMTELYDDEERLGYIKDKVEAFLDKIDDYITKSKLMTVSELLSYILNTGGFMDYVLALPGGIKRAANLNMLINKAASMESGGYKGVNSFVNVIREMKSYDIDLGEANVLSESDNVVRIMSIHKSKGLEFPVVFVSNLQKDFNMMDYKESILLSMDYGVASDYIDPVRRFKRNTIMKAVHKLTGIRDTIGEELRMLYVAMTRAKDKCILTAVTDDYSKLIGGLGTRADYTDVYNAGTYLNWVLMALGPHLDFNGVNTPEFGPDVSKYSDAKVYLYHLTNRDFVNEKIVNTESREKVLNDLVARLDTVKSEDIDMLKHKIQHDYPFSDSTQMKAKYSVSDIKHFHMDKQEEKDEPDKLFEANDKADEMNVLVPEFLGGEGDVYIGALKGTVVHKFMELYDIKQGFNHEEYARVAELMKEYDVDDMSKIFPERKLISFFESDLGKCMVEADRDGKLYKEQQFMVGLKADEVYNDIGVSTVNLEDEKVIVQGIVDAYYINSDDTLTIMDYKTDGVKTPDELRDRYKAQLEYYGRIMKQITGKSIKSLILYSFKLDAEIEV